MDAALFYGEMGGGDFGSLRKEGDTLDSLSHAARDSSLGEETLGGDRNYKMGRFVTGNEGVPWFLRGWIVHDYEGKPTERFKYG